MSTFFISDLHLSQDLAEITELLLKFLSELPSDTEALYILGDFLEYWVGDDDDASWLNPIKLALKKVSVEKCPIYFIHGNRDFLVGQKFANETGMTILAEPSVVNLYNQNVLVLHGDSLCTQDISYQKFRKVVRNKWIQRIFSLLPLTTRHKIFGVGRNKSQEKQKGMKNNQILDVTPEAVSQLMQFHRVDIMIHGHTHRPKIHTHVISTGKGTRIVLGDWYQQGSVLEVNNDGYYLYNLAFAQ